MTHLPVHACAYLKSSLKQGFTLIELLVVVSLLVFMTGAAIPSFNGYIENQNLKQAQSKIDTELRGIQNKALSGSASGEGAIYWVADFSAGSSTFSSFVSDEADINDACSGGPGDSSTPLPGGLLVKNNICVLFSFDNGTTYADQSPINIILGKAGASGTECSSISLNSAGLITEQSGVACFP